MGLEALRDYYDARGLALSDELPEHLALRPHQQDAIEWAAEQSAPYLFINAPTGSGKTLINTTVGLMSEQPWTYAVHTLRLQQQVASQFVDIPVFTGRANHACELMAGTTAADAMCAMPGYQYGECSHDPSGPSMCAYYEQSTRAMSSTARVVNYSLLLSYPPLVVRPRNPQQVGTRVLLCDEAHNVEEAVCSAVTLTLSERTLRRIGVTMPRCRTIMDWAGWARKLIEDDRLKWRGQPDAGFKNLDRTVRTLSTITDAVSGEWLVQRLQYGYVFQPIWGAPYVMEKLLGHKEPPPGATLLDYSSYSTGVRKAVFTSATLMGAEYIARLLGFPDGSWAYLDMPSTFPTANRPINYAPVDAMNAAKVNDPQGRAPMQAAIDNLIEYYVRGQNPWGIIHAVSNKYRDFILTESRWRGIMTSNVDEHEAKCSANEASVLVSSNLSEGWDGKDAFCRFVLMPKIPFPDLGDIRTRLRKEEDPRSYDHRALVAVVQGAGRGVRHREDYADTWILDGAWRQLHARRGEWLPQSFKDAYHHNVPLPF